MSNSDYKNDLSLDTINDAVRVTAKDIEVMAVIATWPLLWGGADA